MTWTDRVTTTPEDCLRAERAHEPQQGRYDDAEPDEPFTMPAIPLDDGPLGRAISRYFGEAS